MNGKLQIETISSIVLKDNPLGDPRRREVPVYLPPSYGSKRGRRYPVFFYLPGFTGTGRGAVNYNPWKENIVDRFDRLIAEGKAREAILIIPDGFTAYGGSQYLNSSATGRYADHVAVELVSFIEDKFAAVRGPEGRALFGSSSGGYGALMLGMRHPEVFGHVAAHSADLGFDACYGTDFPKVCAALQKYGGSVARFVAEFRAARDKSAFDHAAINAVAMAACYSPNPKSQLGFDFPVDVRTGEKIAAVWKRWEAHDPVHACAKHAGELRRLKTLWFDAGTRDEFYLQLGARRFSDALKKLKIKHVHQEHDRGHFDLAARFEVSLAVLSKNCARVD
ncbi:MAG: alpha/beta hydrolase [Elusimicrobiota bacterium]